MAEKKKSSRVVRLNVGGEIFATSTTTLLSGGESFFSSLLSGRHESDRDDSGAYFIDRSPKYFGAIIHYLRTNNLEIPAGLNKQSLQFEAEFYGIQKIVDHLKHLETEKQRIEADRNETILPILKDVGCYVDDGDLNAFMFGNNGKLTHVSGVQAFTQAMVVQNHPKVPEEWKNDSIHSKSFAIFYEQHVNKGTFKMNSEGKGMVLTLSAGGASHSLELRHHLATLSKDLQTVCITSFSSSGSKCVFHCSHDNPHHFHTYKFKKF